MATRIRTGKPSMSQGTRGLTIRLPRRRFRANQSGGTAGAVAASDIAAAIAQVFRAASSGVKRLHGFRQSNKNRTEEENHLAARNTRGLRAARQRQHSGLPFGAAED